MALSVKNKKGAAAGDKRPSRGNGVQQGAADGDHPGIPGRRGRANWLAYREKYGQATSTTTSNTMRGTIEACGLSSGSSLPNHQVGTTNVLVPRTRAATASSSTVVTSRNCRYTTYDPMRPGAVAVDSEDNNSPAGDEFDELQHGRECSIENNPAAIGELVVLTAMPVDEEAEAARDRLLWQLQQERMNQSQYFLELRNQLGRQAGRHGEDDDECSEGTVSVRQEAAGKSSDGLSKSSIDQPFDEEAKTSALTTYRNSLILCIVLVVGAGAVALGLALAKNDNKGGKSPWTQRGQTLQGRPGDFFGGSLDLSDDGMICAGSAFMNNHADNNTGHVRVFEYNSTLETWNPLGQEIDWEVDWADVMGYDVSLSSNGQVLAAGSHWDHQNKTDKGHVRVYRYDSTANVWNQMGQELTGKAEVDLFGWSLALSGNGMIVAVGAFWNDDNGNESGHVRIFHYNQTSGGWNQLGQDVTGETNLDKMGYSVDLSTNGKIMVGGTFYSSYNGINSGRVRAFRFDDVTNHWMPMGQPLDGEAAGDQFGNAVAVSGNGQFLVVGSNRNGQHGPISGNVRAFEYSNITDEWSQLGQTLYGGKGDEFGKSVAISSNGGIIAAGAVSHSGRNGQRSGLVRVFEF